MITLNELSIKTGITYSTVARYTKEFDLYISRKKEGRKLLFFEAEAVETAKRVNQLYKDGKTTEQIHEILQQEKTQTIEIKPIQDEKFISHAKRLLAKQEKRINDLEQEIQELKEQNAKDKSEILQGVNDAMLEFMKMMKDNK